MFYNVSFRMEYKCHCISITNWQPRHDGSVHSTGMLRLESQRAHHRRVMFRIALSTPPACCVSNRSVHTVALRIESQRAHHRHYAYWNRKLNAFSLNRVMTTQLISLRTRNSRNRCRWISQSLPMYPPLGLRLGTV